MATPFRALPLGRLLRLRRPAADFRDFTLFTKEFLEQIIPMIEKNYRVYTDADHRAIGGLSMGAMQSVSIGLSHPELFHYVLAYSGGFGSLALVAGCRSSRGAGSLETINSEFGGNEKMVASAVSGFGTTGDRDAHSRTAARAALQGERYQCSMGGPSRRSRVQRLAQPS